MGERWAVCPLAYKHEYRPLRRAGVSECWFLLLLPPPFSLPRLSASVCSFYHVGPTKCWDFCSFLNSSPQRANPTLCKGWAIKCAAPAVSLSLVIKNTMCLLFREVSHWVSWFKASWQLSTMQPLAHQYIGCQCPSRLIPLLVSLLPSTRFCCAFLKVTSLTHGNVGSQVAAVRNWRSQGHLGFAPIGTKIKWSKEQSAGIAAAAHASVHWPVTGSLLC